MAKPKTLDITNSAQAKKGGVHVVGNPDAWVLLCKAWNTDEKWMKSTKAMYAGNGVLVQVSTESKGQVAEALTFVPRAVLYNAGTKATPEYEIVEYPKEGDNT